MKLVWVLFDTKQWFVVGSTFVQTGLKSGRGSPALAENETLRNEMGLWGRIPLKSASEYAFALSLTLQSLAAATHSSLEDGGISDNVNMWTDRRT